MEIALALTALICAGFVLIVLKQPDEFRVTRSTLISAPPEIVFPHLNSLQKWQSWSPWARMDPEARTIIEGPDEGIGAKLSWEGKKTGQGNMTCLQSRPCEFVQFRLEFLKPMKAVNTAEFSLAHEDGRTRLTWTMFGPNKFAGKAMGLFMNCEKMCGDQFMSGFENLEEVITHRKAA